jgi:hypothetical protein
MKGNEAFASPAGMKMRFFRRRNLRKLLAAANVADAMDYLADPDPGIAQAAWLGVRDLLRFQPARLADAAVVDRLFRMRDDHPDRWPSVIDLLLTTTDPRLVPDATERAIREPRRADGRAAFVYLAGLIDAAPDALRAGCEGDERLVAAIGAALDFSEPISDPFLQAVARLVDFLDLWNDDRICGGCLKLFCRSRWAHAAGLMERILERLLPLVGADFVEPLLYQHGVDPDNQDLESRADEVIVGFGEAARAILMGVIIEYKNAIRSQTQSRTMRNPAYYASQKAIYLLGEVIQRSDREAACFLTEIVADTKLAASGLHKKYAREALMRIGQPV